MTGFVREHMPETSKDTIGDNALADLTATAFLEMLAAGDVTVEEYCTACAERIDQRDPEIQAWAFFDRERFLETAKSFDDILQQHRNAGMERLPRPVHGVPVGVKDIFNTIDMPTSHGSTIMQGYNPGNDARVVGNIRLDGGIVAGKTATAEFAVHHPGKTANPWDFSRTPGTSSSGSAAAVASGMVPVALSTQTAGSTIRPAAYCGVIGFKPSFGLVPRTGVLKTSDTLDTVGLIARSVSDISLFFHIVRTKGHNYPLTEMQVNRPENSVKTHDEWRIGVLHHPFQKMETERNKSRLDATIHMLSESADFEMVEVEMPGRITEAHDIHNTLYRKSLAYYFKPEWETSREKFSATMQEMIESGVAIGTDSYLSACAAQNYMRADFDSFMKEHDLDAIVCASTADEAPPIGTIVEADDTCLIWTLVGAPSITVPLPCRDNAMPLGIQIVGRRFADIKILSLAAEIADHCKSVDSEC